jgi:hypothetical protein
VKKANGLTFGLFLAGLWLPFVGMCLGWGVYSGEEERRSLAPRPSFYDITWLPKQIESYLTDRMGFRKTLTRAHTYILFNCFGLSPTGRVIVGRDGWLFCNNGLMRLFNDPGRPFTPEDLVLWRDVFEQREAWLAEQGIRYLLVIVPNKSTVYPEYLREAPDAFRTRTDQFIECIKGSSVEVLDLRPPLMSGKGSEPLYFRRDTHWNPYGAMLGTNAICERLGLPPFRLEDCTSYPDLRKIDDLASLLGLAGWPEEFQTVAPRSPARRVSLKEDKEARTDTLVMECDQTKDGRLLCLGDSFIYDTRPFLACRFAHTVFAIDMWRPLSFNKDIVAEVRPTVVIQLFVERQFGESLSEDGAPAD